jgi:hypothetical protein
MKDARSKIVEAPLMLILAHGYDFVVSIIAYKGS